MKKILLLGFFYFIISQSYSQVLISILLGDKLNSGKIEFGLDGGVNFTNMSNIEGDKSLGSFHIGFYFDILLKNRWYINTGVLVKSTVGANKINEEGVGILDPDMIYLDTGSYYQEINYFHVPIGLKYRFKNNLYVKFGPQVALRTKAHLFYERNKGNQNAIVKTENSDDFARLELSGFLGTGYTLRQGTGMNVGVKYYYAFTNALKDSDTSVKNNGLYVYVNIPIGRGKAMEKEAANEPGG